MSDNIRLLIHKKKFIYDDLCISSTSQQTYNKQIKSQKLSTADIDNAKQQRENMCLVTLCKKGFNAYSVSVYVHTMNRSVFYRESAIHVLINFIKTRNITPNATSVILIRLRTPKYQFIDYRWNERITQMVMERQEIDHAMSWLSTLGGAFSALGDQFDHCAKIAGKISIEQFKMSMRLGDPQLVSRCKLYAALSLLQQGYFKVCKKMVREIFEFALTEKDIRLQRMCKGVWAKLKYCYSLKKHKPK